MYQNNNKEDNPALSLIYDYANVSETNHLKGLVEIIIKLCIILTIIYTCVFVSLGIIIDSLPIEKWKGGEVNFIRPSVIHLRRGQVFTIEDKKFFAFGGASSHDIQDGIIDGFDPNWKDKAKSLDKQGKYMYRIKGLSWWEQELPTEEEMQTGLDNLAKHNNKVDFILSHSPSTSQLYLLGGKGLYEPDRLSNYLEEIRVNTEYKKHFMGHMHINKAINDKDIVLYEQIVRIN